MGWFGGWKLAILLGLGIFLLINGIIRPRTGSRPFPKLFIPKSILNIALWKFQRFSGRYGRQGLLLAGSLILALYITIPLGRLFSTESASLSQISKELSSLQSKARRKSRTRIQPGSSHW